MSTEPKYPGNQISGYGRGTHTISTPEGVQLFVACLAKGLIQKMVRPKGFEPLTSASGGQTLARLNAS